MTCGCKSKISYSSVPNIDSSGVSVTYDDKVEALEVYNNQIKEPLNDFEAHKDCMVEQMTNTTVSDLIVTNMYSNCISAQQVNAASK